MHLNDRQPNKRRKDVGCLCTRERAYRRTKYNVILSVIDPRKCEYLKDYSLDFEHAYMIIYLAS